MNDGVRPGCVVLVDANVIIEGYRTATWAALVGAFSIETVEDCVTETQTGYKNRPREQWIEVAALRESFAKVHDVTDLERAELAIRLGGIALDRGEESLWAHALGRSGEWLLSGPDRASLRAGVCLGFRDHLVSVEELLETAGYRTRKELKQAYTKKWMRGVVGEMVIAEAGLR
ncbi:hypothetical protein [Candidatus Foliamicus sp.]